MEFLVEFVVHVPDGTPGSDVAQRDSAEASASAELGRQGKLLRLWRPVVGTGERKALGLFRAENMEELDRMLGALPMAEWMQTNVTPLEKHPHDPASRPN
jgi:muconolactone D-isomerase